MTKPASSCGFLVCRSERINNAFPLALERGLIETEHGPDMSTEAKMVEFRRQLAALEASKKATDPAKKMPMRERIRIRMRCRLCGRARAVYRKFGICRICFRDMASDGLIPGVKKASW